MYTLIEFDVTIEEILIEEILDEARAQLRSELAMTLPTPRDLGESLDQSACLDRVSEEAKIVSLDLRARDLSAGTYSVNVTFVTDFEDQAKKFWMSP
jgi:hypothetical protein